MIIKLFISLCFFGSVFADVGISTGPKLGTYFQIGQDLKKILPEIKIKILESAGSADNMEKLQNDPSIHFAITQLDVLRALKDDKKINFKKIKMVLPLFDEEIHLITHAASGIKTIQDLKGKTVNIGKNLSGSQQTAKIISRELGLNWETNLGSTKKAIRALLNRKIDAVCLTIGRPARIYEMLPKEAKKLLRFIPIKSKKLRKYFSPISIPAKTYPWQDEEIQTYSVHSLLVTLNFSNKLYTGLIHNLFKGIRKNIKTFQAEGHPKWKEVVPYFRSTSPLWPIHPVLLRYYKQDSTKKKIERILDKI